MMNRIFIYKYLFRKQNTLTVLYGGHACSVIGAEECGDQEVVGAIK